MKNRIWMLIFCLIVSKMSGAQKIQGDSVSHITVYAIDPHRVMTFSKVSAIELVSEMENSTREDDSSRERFKTIITKEKKIKKLVKGINDLSKCNAVDIEEFDTRIVLEIHFISGLKALIVLEDMLSQRILLSSTECAPNKKFYRNVLSVLPNKWRRNVDLESRDTCGVVHDYDYRW